MQTRLILTFLAASTLAIVRINAAPVPMDSETDAEVAQNQPDTEPELVRDPEAPGAHIDDTDADGTQNEKLEVPKEETEAAPVIPENDSDAETGDSESETQSDGIVVEEDNNAGPDSHTGMHDTVDDGTQPEESHDHPQEQEQSEGAAESEEKQSNPRSYGDPNAQAAGADVDVDETPEEQEIGVANLTEDKQLGDRQASEESAVEPNSGTRISLTASVLALVYLFFV